jgi:hypothetical protein
VSVRSKLGLRNSLQLGMLYVEIYPIAEHLSDFVGLVPLGGSMGAL